MNLNFGQKLICQLKKSCQKLIALEELQFVDWKMCAHVGNLGVLLVTTLKSGCHNDTVCDISLLFTETMQVVLLLPL